MKKNKKTNFERTDKFRIITCNLAVDQVNKMQEYVDKGIFLSKTELARKAVEEYIFSILHHTYYDTLTDIEKEKYKEGISPELNLKNRVNKVQERFGNPRKIHKGIIYEFRFNRLDNPGWVCLGPIEENQGQDYE